jgi:tetratricopeptide (TPR) repeat protein
VGFSREFVDTRLDTWKLIAKYLGRSARTVQRWHAEYGLPVHHLGAEASSVYAYTDELDLWLRRRDGSGTESTARLSRNPSRIPLITLPDKRVGTAENDREPLFAGQDEAQQLVSGAEKLWESVSATNLSTIARMYRRAIDLDPRNAKAYAGLSQALIAQAILGNLHPTGAFHAADVALSRALEIDPGLFEAQCASALLKMCVERDWNAARESLDEAIRKRPKASQALVGRAFLMVAHANLDEASDELRRAALERPLNTSVAELMCWVEYLTGRLESALALILDARQTGHSGAILDTVEGFCRVLVSGAESQIQSLEAGTSDCPRNHTLLGVLGYAYGRTGRTASARQVLDSMTRMGLTGVFDFAYPIALTFLGLGEHGEAARWLAQSYKHGSLWSLGFASDPILETLRTDMNFRDFCGPKNYPTNSLHHGLGVLQVS